MFLLGVACGIMLVFLAAALAWMYLLSKALRGKHRVD